METLRLLTAGSVDDGKSTLIGRLFFDTDKICEDQLAAMERASFKQGNEHINLALFTDGLKAEREQGITIDVSYRYFESENRKIILADAPGHFEYTSNMVTAASQSDVVLILIDVQKGVTLQTKRHFWICQWLGIKKFIVCVNKLDLFQYDVNKFLEIKNEIETWLLKYPDQREVHFLPMSALEGVGITKKIPEMSWYNGPLLLEWLDQVELHSSIDLEASTAIVEERIRFSVQMMILPKNSKDFNYRGYAGKLVDGSLRVGTHLYCKRTERKLKIQKIEKYGNEVLVANRGDLVTLLFEEDTDLSRGDTLFNLNAPLSGSTIWEVELFILGKKMSLDQVFYARKETFETKCTLLEINEEFNLNELKWISTEESSFSSHQILKGKLKFQHEVFSDGFGITKDSGKMVLIHENQHGTCAAILLKKPVSE